MKKILRIFASLLASAMLTLSITACGAVPEGYQYVETLLPLYYDDDASSYVAFTGEDQAEAEALYDAAFNRTLSYFKTYYSVTSWEDDTKEQALALYQKIYKEKRRVNIVGCTDGQHSWTVTLEIEPFELFRDADDDYQAFLTRFLDDYRSGKTTYEDKTAYLNAYAAELVDLMEAHVDTAGYGEPTTLEVTVTKDADGNYQLADGDKAYLDVAILPYPDDLGNNTAESEDAD